MKQTHQPGARTMADMMAQYADAEYKHMRDDVFDGPLTL